MYTVCICILFVFTNKLHNLLLIKYSKYLLVRVKFSFTTMMTLLSDQLTKCKAIVSKILN